MSFVYPNFLWALTAVSIPIIIHFFNFRTYKTVYFSNVSFLENIEQESKSRNRIKDLLILLFRILTIISLVFAFANPVKYNSYNKTNNCHNLNCIYLDNSFSMNALNKDGTCIEVAKSRATDIVSSLKLNSKYLFLTNNLTPQEQHFYISDIIKDNISKTNVSPISKNIDFIIEKMQTIVNRNTENDCYPDIYLISDFQKNIFNFENIKIDSNIRVFLIPVTPNSIDNLYIDSAWFESPFHLLGNQDSITVSIVNQGKTDMVNQQIKLFINDTLKTLSTFNITANSSTEIKVIFTNTRAGDITGRVEIEDYPVTYDNKLYFDYYISPRQNILLIESEKQEMLEKFYSDDKYFNLKTCNSSNIPISELNQFQTIILNSQDNLSSGIIEKLHEYVEKSGVLLFIPKNIADLKQLNNLFEKFELPMFSSLDTQKYFIKNINIQDKIYKNAFKEIKGNSIFPFVQSHYKINTSNFYNINTILSLENNDDLLFYKNVGLGTIYVFTSNLDEQNSDFMTNSICVPTFYNIPVFSSSNKIPFYFLKNLNIIELHNVKIFEAIKMKNKASDFEFFPQIRKQTSSSIKLTIKNILPEAGNYKVFSGKNKIGLISLNYNRIESDFKYYTAPELNEQIKKYNLINWKIYSSKGLKLQNHVKLKDTGEYYWKYFIIFALLFLLAEILTIKFFKNK
ncbi:MAG: BatA domain-containing protein [Bacteroidota bacterium]|nr:BatA domain-containing protein [Bacteroidota bacterium]